ncbi:MAG TPA: hypothetical protein VKB03_05300 [Conexibacter sp.]|nr:hypothetical protein [Conexibacter sp.]
MTDAVDAAANNGQPTVEHAALAAETGAPVAAVAPAPSPADERPELVVGAAFAGGLVLALFLKRLAR